MMQAIRSKAGKIIVYPVIIGFLGWMVFEIGVGGGGGMGPTEVGVVEGQSISAEMWQTVYQQEYNQAQQRTGGRLSADEIAAIEDRAWDRLVQELLIERELQRRGITVSNEEIRAAARTQPIPRAMQEPLFQTDGQFDMRKYQEFLAGPQGATLYPDIEAFFRSAIPRAKLSRQIAAGAYLSDAELWRDFQDRTETATVEYVTLDLARLAPGEVTVPDAEVRRYYEENREELERPATARMRVAYFPLVITAADRAATLERARAVRQQIVGGADFAEVARRESADRASAEQGGDLGTFRRGQMVPAFEQAVSSLPIGEVSEPVLTEFGYHLIQVQERTDSTATARHILLPVEKSEAELARLDDLADELQRAVEGGEDLEKAARRTGATFRADVPVTATAPFIPEVGSAREALQWAASIADDEEESRVSDIFENPGQALYVTELVRFQPKGQMSLAEATPQIRRDLQVEKKREQARAEGQKIVAEVRGGRSLQEVAAARGLQVGTAGPFTRREPNPALGQFNAAIGAAFGTPLNQVSDVVETPAGLFLIRPTARTEAERAAWEAQKEQQRQILSFQLEQEILGQWLESLRRSAEIEDYRDELLRGYSL